MKKKIVLSSLFLLLIWSSCLIAADYQFKTIAVPDARHTMSFGINDLGDVVGVTSDCDFCQAGAFLFSDGKYYDLAVYGALQTTPFGINRDGTIAGTFIGGGNQLAFLMDTQKTTVLDQAVRADALNNRGVAVGYRMVGAIDPRYEYGYIWQNGQYIQPVTTAEVPGILGSALTGVNDRGDTVGYYWYNTASGQVTQGFMRNVAGELTPLNILPLGINRWGQIVGLSGAGNDGAFRDEFGVVQLIKAPGADYTQVHGINNVGHLVGYYVKAGQHFGFVAIETPLSKAKRKGDK